MKACVGKSAVFLLVLALVVGCGESSRFYSNVLRSDVFTQMYDSTKYDFLWVFDNSGSMADRRAYVRNNMNHFINVLNSRKAINFRMAMTTTDYFTHSGALVQSPSGLKVVSSTAADPVGDFASIIDNVQNSPTSFWEQGLESSYAAVSIHGSQFMRSDADLIVIYVTDEDDFSCKANCFGVEPENNPDDEVWEMDRYKNYFANVKRPHNKETLVFPIVGLHLTNPCSVASVGARYVELQQYFDTGTSGGICLSQLPSSFQAVARFLADRGVVFPLTVPATGDGISVFVNGVNVPYSEDDGYVFDASLNAIVFTGNSIPPNGATIEVVYTEQSG